MSSPASAEPDGPAERTAGGETDAGPARRSKVLWTLVAINTAVIVWVMVTGGGKYDFGVVDISVTHDRRPILILFGLVVLVTWRDRPLGFRFDELVKSSLARAWTLPIPSRIGLLVLAAAGASNLSAWWDIGDTLLDLRNQWDVSADTALIDNGAQPHLPEAIGLIATRPGSEPVVLHVRSHDRRAQLIAYYSYPRLVLMEPGARRWALRERMLHRPGVDPSFDLSTPRPSVERSKAFADARGLELVVVGEEIDEEASAWD